MIRVAAFLFFALFGNTLIADPMSIVEVNPDDKSVEYLKYIFGNTVNVMIGGEGPDEPDAVLGAMSAVLCAGMLVFTGILIIYVLLSGTLDSANEGNPLGKTLSTMWVPLRMVLALGLVLPLAGGYSTMQVGVLWVAGHGIGLANSVWNGALDHIQGKGSLYPPDININHEQIASQILASRVCLHAANQIRGHEVVIDKPYSVTTPASGVDTDESAAVEMGSNTPGMKIMQRYTGKYTDASEVDSLIEAADGDISNGQPLFFEQANPCGAVALQFPAIDGSGDFLGSKAAFRVSIAGALSELDAAMDPIAQSIANQVRNNGDAPDPAAFYDAVHTYQNAYLAATQALMSDLATARTESWVDGNPENAMTTMGARDAGWITAGAWYWELQKANAEAHDMVMVDPSYMAPTAEVANLDGYIDYVHALEAYDGTKLIPDGNGGTINKLEAESIGHGGIQINGSGYGGIKQYLSGLTTVLDILHTQPDPVRGLQDFGHAIIIMSEVTWLATRSATTIAESAELVARTKGGVIGAVANAIAAPIALLAKHGMAVLTVAIMLVAPLAMMLAFYLPAMPLIIWIAGVAGWFVLLIEAVIAAPIWAASHAMPEGNGFVGQRAHAGYMVLLSLFLRPTLMLFGFFASMLLMIAMMKVAILLYYPAVSSISGNRIVGIAGWIGYTAILVIIVIGTAHRAYGLIHEIPDKVLRYIGFGNENLGEANNEKEGKALFVGGASRVEKAMAPKKDKPRDGEDSEGSGRGKGDSGDGRGDSGSTSSASKTNKDLSTGGR